MSNCCENKGEELAALRSSQKHVLITVLVINTIMFFVEFTAGVIARSTALMADSLDMLGDAAVYVFSIYVLEKSSRWKARAALLKGLIVVAFGLAVLGEGTSKMFADVVPVPETMGWIGGLALVANATCLILLSRYRNDDLNMRSTWICSRNDIISNTGVLIAAAAVGWTGSKWPDIAIGVIIAFVFLGSAAPILKESVEELRDK